MEPQYMMMGQAAGMAAKLAIDNHQAVQDIDTGGIGKRLKEQWAVLEFMPSRQTPIIMFLHKSLRAKPTPSPSR